MAATPEQVWAVITDPVVFEGIDPLTRVVETEGTPGEVDFQYTAIRGGLSWVTVIMEAKVNRRLGVAKLSPAGRILAGEYAQIFREGDRADVRWSVVQFPRWYTRPFVAVGARWALADWLRKLEAQVVHEGERAD